MFQNLICCFAFLASLGYVQSLPLPNNEYAFIQARSKLKQLGNYGLSDEETIVNIYFQKLKQDEFKNTLDYFLPARPIEDTLDSIIKSPVFSVLKELPKGGNLHIHEGQMLDRKVFLEKISNMPEFDMLYICDKASDPECQTPNKCTCTDYFLRYIPKNVEAGWIKVKGSSKWTFDEIASKTNLIGVIKNSNEQVYPTDTGKRWNLAGQGIFGYYTEIYNHKSTRIAYLEACLDYNMAENAQILELRRSPFGQMYEFDENGDRKNVPIDTELELMQKLKDDYLAKNKDFIDFVFLIYSSRRNDASVILKEILSSYDTYQKYETLVRGYDMVGEEDKGHTLLFHSESLIKGFGLTNNQSSFKYYFHTAETNWPDDFIPAQYGDAVSTLENIYDAIIFRTQRIGHGTAFIKHPELNQILKSRQIAFEICPASNQLLGYVSDLRNHPAINYHRNGIPIVIAGDDPGSFGYNYLTVDYYLVFMAWGLNLYDLKQIANNSVRYSSIPENVKTQGYVKFNKRWNNFITKFHDKVCNEEVENFKDSVVDVSNVFPSLGPVDRSVQISINGYGFEKLLCKQITCLFDNVETSGHMITIDEIKCNTPLGMKENTEVELSLKSSDSVIKTGKKYKFASAKEVEVIDDDTTVSTITTKSNKSNIIYSNRILLVVCLFIYFIFSKNNLSLD